MVAIRMIPMRVAAVNASIGPSSTAPVILIRCAMGHIPSMRSIGEITTPSPISTPIITSRSTLPFLPFCSLISFKKIHSLVRI